MTLSLIPLPAAFRATERESCRLDARSTVVTTSDDPAWAVLARRLGAWLGVATAEAGVKDAATVRLIADATLASKLGPEGYRLEASADGVTIRAAGVAGAGSGVQTLRQLLPPEVERLGVGAAKSITVPAVEIEDRPRFKWRGVMVDASRHFFSVGELKRLIDLLELHKFNVFHWHLADDQGWRLEIKRFPLLTATGAWRTESPRYGDSSKGDGRPTGGYYTQEQVRDLVTYAGARGITVVPEIELPGHASAAIAAYPEFGNRDVPGYAPTVATRWGIQPYTYAPRDEVFQFIDGIFAEVTELFPSTYIHVGGDEAIKDQWRASARAQRVIREQGLRNEDELQSWFIRRAEALLTARGRRLIGWDEINEGGLSPTATMMVWRDWKWAHHAIERGNDVIMSPVTHCYLDHYQADPKTGDEPEAIPSHVIPLDQVYAMEPVPEGLTPEQQQRVLGVQGNLWTEFIPTYAQLEYMAFPRLSALAEVAWSRSASKDWNGFLQRLERMGARLDVLGVNYRRWQPAPGGQSG